MSCVRPFVMILFRGTVVAHGDRDCANFSSYYFFACCLFNPRITILVSTIDFLAEFDLFRSSFEAIPPFCIRLAPALAPFGLHYICSVLSLLQSKKKVCKSN